MYPHVINIQPLMAVVRESGSYGIEIWDTDLGKIAVFLAQGK